MTRPVLLSPVYNALTGNVSAGVLDTTFAQVAAAINDLSNCSVYLVDTGAVNALAVNPAPATVNIDQGTTIDVLVSSANTAPATLTIAGSTNIVGAVTVTDGQGNPLSAGTLLGNTVYRMVYIGSVWRAAGTLAGGGIGPVAATTLTASGLATVASLAVSQGGIQIAVPVSGASLILNSIADGTAINGGDGVVFWQVNTNAGTLQFGTSDAVGMSLYTNNITRFVLGALGGATLNNPTTALDTLTINNTISGTAMCLVLNGSAAGTPKIKLNQIASGAGGAQALIASSSFISSNKPGGATNVVAWIPIIYDGNVGYIPMWG